MPGAQLGIFKGRGYEKGHTNTRGVARTIKVMVINEKLLATPSTSLKICYYPLHPPILNGGNTEGLLISLH